MKSSLRGPATKSLAFLWRRRKSYLWSRWVSGKRLPSPCYPSCVGVRVKNGSLGHRSRGDLCFLPRHVYAHSTGRLGCFLFRVWVGKHEPGPTVEGILIQLPSTSISTKTLLHREAWGHGHKLCQGLLLTSPIPSPTMPPLTFFVFFLGDGGVFCAIQSQTCLIWILTPSASPEPCLLSHSLSPVSSNACILKKIKIKEQTATQLYTSILHLFPLIVKFQESSWNNHMVSLLLLTLQSTPTSLLPPSCPEIALRQRPSPYQTQCPFSGLSWLFCGI